MIWFRGRKNCQRISENRRIKRSRESGFSLTRYLLWCVYVQREDFTLYIYDLELRKVLITHDVTWSRKDSFCKGQFTDDQPEEKPSVPVKISITQKKEDPPKSAFAKFAFGGDRNE